MAVHRSNVFSFACGRSVTLTIRKIEQEILAAGHEVMILTTSSGDSENTHLNGTHPNREVVFLDNSIPLAFLHDPHNPDLQYHFGVNLSRAMKEQIDEFEPSIIHITVPDCTCLQLIEYARAKEIPLMGTYHSNIPEYLVHYPGVSFLKHIISGYFRHQYNFLQALYVPTPFIQKYLSDTYKMDKVTNLQVWGRGIDLHTFSPTHRSLKFRRSLGIDDHDVVICWVGRLVPEKRTDVFANVIRRLHARNVPYHALIVGAGSQQDELSELPNTTFCGWLNGDQLSVAYASSDVFVFPSAVETFGNVTLEAAASGLPLVVDAGCSGHLVNDGINGFACTDEDSFFDATLRLVVDEELRDQCRLASRELSLHFEQHAVVRRMLDNYDTVTEEFYCKYGGHHENRDKIYQQDPDSFTGGTHPRPFAYMVAEIVLIILFRIICWMASAFFWFRGCTTRRMVQMAPAPPAASPVATRKSKMKRHDSRELSLLEEGDADNDDASSATDSLSESSASSSCCSSGADTCISIVDGPCMHSLAKGFVRLMLCQSRMESNLRNCVSARISRTTARKRKDSSMTKALMTRSHGSEESFVHSRAETLERRSRRSPMSGGRMLEAQ